MRRFIEKIPKPRKKTVKTFQVYMSIVAAIISIALFMLAVTGIDRFFEPHRKCLDGVLYYKFALSMTVAYSVDGKPKKCGAKNGE